MKCQRKDVAVARVLRLQVLRPVLADHLDPGLDQHGQVLHRDVLGGGDDRHLGAELAADALVVRPDCLSRRSR